MNQARRKAALVRSVKYNSEAIPDPEFDKTLIKHDVPPVPDNTSSLLTLQLERKPKLPQNKFLEYAKFDGTAQTGMLTRDFKIFVKMLDERQRRYPIHINVLGSATIQQLTGLICYKCSIQYPDVELNSAKQYSIFLVEEDGSIEPDFPPLEPLEPCSKFCFANLAIGPRGERAESSPSIRMEFPSFSMTSEVQSKAEAVWEDLKQLKLKQSEDNRRMDFHNTLIEAPTYRSYRIYCKARLKHEVQLGVSGEKIEIDPVSQRNSRFWVKQKAVSLPMETVASCDKLETKPNKTTFRVIYSPVHGPYYSVQASPSVSGTYKHYDFETDPNTAQEIVDKINNILELSASNSRREYLAFREIEQRRNRSIKKKSGNKIF